MTELCRWLLLSVLVLIAAAKVLHPAGRGVGKWLDGSACRLSGGEHCGHACSRATCETRLPARAAPCDAGYRGCFGQPEVVWVYRRVGELGHAEHMVVASLLGLLATLCHFAWR